MVIKRNVFIGLVIACSSPGVTAQLPYDSISQTYVEKTLNYLASDELKGRVNYTKEQLKAAEYLGNEFSRFGLDPFPGFTNFFIPFRPSEKRERVEKLEWNDKKIPDSLFFYIPSRLRNESAKLKDFMVLRVDYPVADSVIYLNWRHKELKTLLWVVLPDSIGFTQAFQDVVFPSGMPMSDLLVVAAKEEPVSMKFSASKDRINTVLYNVVGMLPGDSLPDEVIIFSAHYDHIDEGLSGESGRVFNGANDNASGSTAVLALAQYFAQRSDNKRTILFCLFAGEEMGLLGSYHFVNLVKPETIKAVLNIEMIGKTNASGENAFHLIGSWHSDLIDILEKNLNGDKIKVMKQRTDPQVLFQRSDNYPFYLAGIPAHTIMCSDDKEPCYHKYCDTADRIEIDNMTRVIRGIAKGSATLINGTDTPQLKK